MNTIGQILIQKRSSLSQTDIANKVGVSQSTYGRWEADSSIPKVDQLVKLAEVFQCKVWELIPSNLHVKIEPQKEAGNHQKENTYNARTLLEDLAFTQNKYILGLETKVDSLEKLVEQLRQENQDLLHQANNGTNRVVDN